MVAERHVVSCPVPLGRSTGAWRARVVMELLYASRQSDSDVPRARVNLPAEFCSRMRRGGPARYGTPQADFGYFFPVDLYRESYSKLKSASWRRQGCKSSFSG